MLWIAIRMLTGDAQKFYGLLFGIAFSTLLITKQMTIFVNLVQRGASGVYNAPEAEVWVMDPVSRTTDVSYAMPSTALDKVRSVKGVEWAVPHLRAPLSYSTGSGRGKGRKGGRGRTSNTRKATRRSPGCAESRQSRQRLTVTPKVDSDAKG